MTSAYPLQAYQNPLTSAKIAAPDKLDHSDVDYEDTDGHNVVMPSSSMTVKQIGMCGNNVSGGKNDFKKILIMSLAR